MTIVNWCIDLLSAIISVYCEWHEINYIENRLDVVECWGDAAFVLVLFS